MSRKLSRPLRGIRKNTFAGVVLGAAVASLAWLAFVMVVGTTPTEARERRAVPSLPIPVAPVQSTVLRQVAWLDCSRAVNTVSITAPQVPVGQRPLVTGLTRAGDSAETGTVLATVAGRPVIAVVTESPLYRDLALGDAGADVVALEAALRAAQLIGSADSVIDGGTLQAWHALDPTGPTNRISISTIALVPGQATIGSVAVQIGDSVKPGTPLMEVDVSSEAFSCSGLAPGGELRTGSVALKVSGQSVPVERITVSGLSDPALATGPRTVLVHPASDIDGDTARLAVVASDTKSAVLAVPASCIKTDAAGDTTITVVVNGSRREVPVELGATAQGLIQITGRNLAAGDEVEIFGQAGTRPPS